MVVWICRELTCSISSVLIYYEPESEIRVKSYGHLNFSIASMRHFQAFQNIVGLTHTSKTKLWLFEFSESFRVKFWPFPYIMHLNQHPREMLWQFELLESFHCSLFNISKYHAPHRYTWVKSHNCLNFLRASVYNFESLDILWALIGHPSETLWPFEFLESFYCSFFSISIYHGPHTYTWVKSYGRLNFPRAFVFNFELLDILWAGIGDPSEKLRPF